MLSLVLSLALAQDDPARSFSCELESPVRDPTVCEPLVDEGDFKIYSVESVAVGSEAEMKSVRPRARECGLTNRIDYLGMVDVAVFDIFDASETSRECMLSWIRMHVPHLAFSEKRLQQRLSEAPLLEDARE